MMQQVRRHLYNCPRLCHRLIVFDIFIVTVLSSCRLVVFVSSSCRLVLSLSFRIRRVIFFFVVTTRKGRNELMKNNESSEQNLYFLIQKLLNYRNKFNIWTTRENFMSVKLTGTIYTLRKSVTFPVMSCGWLRRS